MRLFTSLSSLTYITQRFNSVLAHSITNSCTTAFLFKSSGKILCGKPRATRFSAMVDDTEYPGTAVERMLAIRDRVNNFGEDDLDGPWVEVRRKILWAGGLRDLEKAVPGRGYTGHSFNDYNHVDLTAMRDGNSDNKNDGSVKGIQVGNFLGDGIRTASLPELGPGGSWSTCAIGCNMEPPQDVAHVQFKSRIAFKLVWVPTPNEKYDKFVLVDDDGKLLAKGSPIGGPSLREKITNYRTVTGSKYAVEADKLANSMR